MKRRAVSGFTLIEVMIVVALVAILASVALPSYADHLRRAQLPEAFFHLSDYKLKMEQYYQDNRGYGSLGGTACADGPSAPVWSDFAPATAKLFSFDCRLASATDNQAYVITATGTQGRAVGHVYTLTTSLSGIGMEGTLRFKDVAVSKRCWLSKGSEC
jgi:type IV pilus assembly protein PilE